MNKIIIGTGSYLPQKVITNEDLLDIVTDFDPSKVHKSLPEWVEDRFGVVSRHWIGDDEATSDIAVGAAKEALKDANISPDQIDLIVLSTVTPDYKAPTTGSEVQKKLGISAEVIDIHVACPGFIKGLMVAESLMDKMGYKHSLVIASEAMSTIIDKSKFFDAGLFGDGAGAVVITAGQNGLYGMKEFVSNTYGNKGKALLIPAGGSKEQITLDNLDKRRQYLVSDHKVVYNYAVNEYPRCVEELCKKAKVDKEDIDWIVPHQSSKNIIEEGSKKLGVSPEKVINNLKQTGNTSSASVPIALDLLNKSSKIKDGDKMILVAMGAGLSSAAVYLVWDS